MLLRLLLLFTLLPFVELTLLAWFSAHTDWRLTVLFVIGTGIAGAWLIRVQGWRTWRQIRDELAAGQVPAEAIQDGLLILVAGLLLVTPGVLTDLVGVLLLIPPVRKLVRAWLRRRWQVRFQMHAFGRGPDWPPGANRPVTDDFYRRQLQTGRLIVTFWRRYHRRLKAALPSPHHDTRSEPLMHLVASGVACHAAGSASEFELQNGNGGNYSGESRRARRWADANVNRIAGDIIVGRAARFGPMNVSADVATPAISAVSVPSSAARS